MTTGNLTAFGARRALPVWNKYEVSADGTPIGLSGPCVVGSIYCITAGTLTGVYNSSGGAVGTNLVPAAVLTARQRVDFGDGLGALFTGGIYLDITGGTYLVLAVPGV